MSNHDSLLPRPEPSNPPYSWRANRATNWYRRIDLDPDPENAQIPRLIKPQHDTYQHRIGRFNASFSHRHMAQRNAEVMASIRRPELTPTPYQPPTRADLHNLQPITHHDHGRQSTSSPSQPPIHVPSPLPFNSPAPDDPLNARHQTPKPTPITSYDGSRGRVKMNSKQVEGRGYTRPHEDSDEDLPVHASYARRKRELQAWISKKFDDEEQGAFSYTAQAMLSNSLEASCGSTLGTFESKTEPVRTEPDPQYQHDKQELRYNLRYKRELDAKIRNRKLDDVEQDETGYEAEMDSPTSSYYSTCSSFDSDDSENDDVSDGVSNSGCASSVADNDSWEASSPSSVRKHESPFPLDSKQLRISDPVVDSGYQTQIPNPSMHTLSSDRKDQPDANLSAHFPNHRKIDMPELNQCVDSAEFIISLASPSRPGQRYGIIIVTASDGGDTLRLSRDGVGDDGSRKAEKAGDEQWEVLHAARLGMDCSGYITYDDEIGDGLG